MTDRRDAAVILDLDGVLTRTARQHARAWKEMFDEFLRRRTARPGEDAAPFDIDRDYRAYIDGKPRLDGVRSFLASRGIELPEGQPDDDQTTETVHGLGTRKNGLFLDLLEREQIEVFDDAVEQVERWRGEGRRLALITSSRNGRRILAAAGLDHLFDVTMDGVDAERLGIAGKPAPDIFLRAARALDVDPADAVVVEDAVAGVEAGRAGGFGLVVGVAREDGDDLRNAGAHLVVRDLRDVDLADVGAGGVRRPLHAIEQFDRIAARLEGRTAVLFFDYDGTLTPIVRRPEEAVLADDMRALLGDLASRVTLGIISGRDLADVRAMVGVDGLFYAGSHGFDVEGPGSLRMQRADAGDHLPELDAAERELREGLQGIDGAWVERKKFALAIHYREVDDRDTVRVEAAVDAVRAARPRLRKKTGKKIFELQPDVAWDKGKAVRWLLETLELSGKNVLPVFFGDDVTDEDAFAALAADGLTIRVGPPDEPTHARFHVWTTDELQQLLRELVVRLGAGEDDDGNRRPREEGRRAQASTGPLPVTARLDREIGAWELIYTAWNPGEQPLREALCALGNGHIVTRGAFEEVAAGDPHYPGTYLAGGYNRLQTEVAGRIVENEDLVNWPNWLPLTFRVGDGDWFAPDRVELLEFRLRLDVWRGVLERTLRFRDAEGRESSLVSCRLVHVAQPHLAAIEWTLTPLNWSGEIEIRSELDGTVRNENVKRYRALATEHLDVLGSGHDGDDTMYLSVATNQSRVRMTQAARTRVFTAGRPVNVTRARDGADGRIAHRLQVPVTEGEALRVEKVVAIHTSRDFAISEPEVNARVAVVRAGSFAELLSSHELRWRHLWNISDIELENGDAETQLILRLHIFHLLQTASPNTIDRDVGVPARGWHGEAYRGHIFWDELFIFPFLSLRMPELTRSLLMYRYRRLDEARHLAREWGYEGAMYPWQSGSDGREESQKLHLNPKSGRWLPDESNLQRHVSAAIAYNVWRYHEATCDMEFLSSHGAEMLVEIARFWASIATFDPSRGRYEICGVMGPDEFHTRYPGEEAPGLRNNAYTNVMAAWVLRCASGVLQLLSGERRQSLSEELQIRDDELRRWDDISRRLFVPFHGDGIISQFEGYAELREFPWEAVRERHGDIQRLDRILEADGDDVNRYQASKQADVLMLFYLFSAEELRDLFEHMGHRFDGGMIPRTIAYYMRRTSHGSTLSRIVHYWVMARGNRAYDWRLFQEALRSDIDDIQGGTTHEGIHLGAMAGTVDLIQRCHMGLEMRDGVLWFDPRLPRELSRVRLRVRYRGHWLSVLVSGQALVVSFDRGWSSRVRIGVRGQVHEMAQGETRRFPLGD
jgi:alpha,alpha-trehalase